MPPDVKRYIGDLIRDSQRLQFLADYWPGVSVPSGREPYWKIETDRHYAEGADLRKVIDEVMSACIDSAPGLQSPLLCRHDVVVDGLCDLCKCEV